MVVNTIQKILVWGVDDFGKYVVTITSINNAFYIVNTITGKRIIGLVIVNSRESVTTTVGIKLSVPVLTKPPLGAGTSTLGILFSLSPLIMSSPARVLAMPVLKIFLPQTRGQHHPVQ